MNPQEPAAMSASLPATETAPTPAQVATATAWTALRDALAAEALADAEGFDRLTGFRAAVIRLTKRYEAGEPPHTPRASKAAA